MRRREFLPVLAAALLIEDTVEGKIAPQTLKGRIRQGVTRDVFRDAKMTFDDMCREAAKLGIQGFDLVEPADWPMLEKYGLVSSLYPDGPGGTISDGLNRTENHAKIEASLRAAINRAAEANVPNIITFSGNRRGLDDRAGADNCVAFLDNIKSHAEDKGVTICLEMLNSKVDHKDYQFDHMYWGVDVVKRVNSPRVKILYDIHHAQIMDGDVVTSIRRNIQHIGHFHMRATPELNQEFILQEIAALGFDGYVSHSYLKSMTRRPAGPA